jgi:Putative restriction endonuclease
MLEENDRLTEDKTMSTITQPTPVVPSISSPPSPVSDLIDASEKLYRLSVEEYERIGEFLDDARVELIDGLLVAKMTQKPPHVVGCELTREVIAITVPTGWHLREAKPVRLARSEPEPDFSLVRGKARDYVNRHPGPADIALVVEVADSSLAKDRRRTGIYGPGGIPIYWIVNLVDRRVEVYGNPGPDGYASQVVYAVGMDVPLVIDGVTVGRIAVADMLP